MRQVLFLLAFVALASALSPSGLSSSHEEYYYQPDLAMRALYYNKAAYCTPASIQNWNCTSCEFTPRFKTFSVHNNATMQLKAFTGYDPDHDQIVIAFQGMKALSFKTWFENLKFELIDYPHCKGCKVHQGFLQVYTNMIPPLLRDMEKLKQKYNKSSVLVAGYSFGAAMSVLAGIDLVLNTSVQDFKLYTFGEPRVGNPAFAAFVTKTLPGGRQFRVTHHQDPVPHLPPEFFGYLHAPHELWYNNNGNTTWKDCHDNATTEDPTCSDSVPVPIDIPDHWKYLGECTMCNCTAGSEEMLELQLFAQQGLKSPVPKEEKRLKRYKNNKQPELELPKEILLQEGHYEPTMAERTLYYTKTAYCTPAAIMRWNCTSCWYAPHFKPFSVHNNASMQLKAYTGYDPDMNQVVIAFQGMVASNFKTWFENLKFEKVKYSRCSGCEVHLGFWQVYTHMSPPLLRDVQSLLHMYPGASLLVAGYSFGAAMSVLAAADLAAMTNVSDFKLYNFGEPRVGNPAFAAYLTQVLPQERQFRVTHRHDPVPHVPPEFFGFLHAPHELWYDNDGNTTYRDCKDSATAEDPKCSDSVKLPIDIPDHLHYLGICAHCDCSKDSEETKAFENIGEVKMPEGSVVN